MTLLLNAAGATTNTCSAPPDWTSWATVALTAVLALVTGYYAWVTRGMLNESKISRSQQEARHLEGEASTFAAWVVEFAPNGNRTAKLVVHARNGGQQMITLRSVDVIDAVTGVAMPVDLGHARPVPPSQTVEIEQRQLRITEDQGGDVGLRVTFRDGFGRIWSREVDGALAVLQQK